MRVAIYRRYGPPSVVKIEDTPKPVPANNEVLVRVHATTVGAPDWRGRKADHPINRFYGGVLKPRAPVIGGMEFSGEVVEVGKDVKRFKLGDRIFGCPGFKGGAHAEYLRVPEMSWTAPVPPNVSLDDAAALFFGAGTCLTFFGAAGIAPGRSVLVNGASGAVGVAAVEIAKHQGARVTGVCGPTNQELVRTLGADPTIDYTREDFARAGRSYDVIVDTVGKNVGQCLRALKHGGALLLINGPMLPSAARLWAASTGAAKIIGPMPP